MALHPNAIPIRRGDDADGIPRRVLFAAATALNNPLLTRSPPSTTTILAFIRHQPGVMPSVHWNLNSAQSKGLKSTMKQQQLSPPLPYPPSSKMDWVNSPRPQNRTPVKDGSSVLELIVPWRQPQPRRGWSYCRMVVHADMETVFA